MKDYPRGRISSAMADRSKQPAAAAAERGFSPLNPLDSEVCEASSYPLSFPSQPPDIRNWFSSYEYESPECSSLAHDLHSFLPPPAEEHGEKTQDPLGISPAKAEVSPAVKDKHPAESPLLIPRERDVHCSVKLEHNSCPVNGSITLKEEPNILPEVGEKSSRKDHGSETADSNHNLSTVNENFVEGHERSPNWLPATTESKEHVSHQQGSRESSPILLKIGKDLDAALEVSHEEELLPRCNIGKDGFVSVKNNHNTRNGGETSPCSSSSKVKYGNLIADESFRENRFLPLKRKQNLQQLFGEGFLTKYSTEENNDLISAKIYKENLDEKDWRRDDDKYSSGKIKEEETSQEKPPSSRFINEELKENDATSGFVSARKREITNDDDRNLPPKSVSVMNYKDTTLENGVVRRETNEHMMNEDQTFIQNNGNLEGKEEAAQEGKRRPLADKTNLQAGVVAVAPEIPGKWQCPRRSKPYMGPPLRQLRLERWINRAT